MVNRRGTSSVGCLTVLAFLAAAVFVGVRIGEPYYRYYQFHDAVQQEAHFAAFRTDSALRQDIWTNADSLQLPDGAYRVFIKRGQSSIRIHTAYDDVWSLWRYQRPVHFSVDINSRL